MPFTCDRISPAVPASSVTTSLPAGDTAWTRAPGSAAICSDTPCARLGVECTTRLVICSSSLMGAPPASASRRADDQLVHPDEEAPAGDEYHSQHRRHDDGKEQETAQL